MDVAPRDRCPVCAAPLATIGGRPRCTNRECPRCGPADPSTAPADCCSGAPLDPVPADAAPPVRVRWTPER